MKKNKKTLAIGIPAYNEEKNIKFLLKALAKQKINGLEIKKIIVVSDGSTDRTVMIAKSIKIPQLKVIDNKKRLGKTSRLNEISKLANTDILVLLDADILPANSNFIQMIADPLLRDEGIGVVGADTESTPAKSAFENAIVISHNLKREIYKKIKNGNNIYFCHGRARAFSKNFYVQLKYPSSLPEDAYSYLQCIKKGFKFVFAPKAKVLFKSPATFSDHAKQSTRFIKGIKNINSYFPKRFIEKEYNIPKLFILQKIIKYFFLFPKEIITYLAISIYIRLFKSDSEIDTKQWSTSSTTKQVTL